MQRHRSQALLDAIQFNNLIPERLANNGTLYCNLTIRNASASQSTPAPGNGWTQSTLMHCSPSTSVEIAVQLAKTTQSSIIVCSTDSSAACLALAREQVVLPQAPVAHPAVATHIPNLSPTVCPELTRRRARTTLISCWCSSRHASW